MVWHPTLFTVTYSRKLFIVTHEHHPEVTAYCSVFHRGGKSSRITERYGDIVIISIFISRL